MSATESTALAKDCLRITAIPGAALPLESCRWTEDQRGANAHFMHLLGELTGRLEASADGCYQQKGKPATWMRLDQIDATPIEAVVNRIRRLYGHWTFDTGSAETFLDRLDIHFVHAQIRKIRGLV